MSLGDKSVTELSFEAAFNNLKSGADCDLGIGGDTTVGFEFNGGLIFEVLDMDVTTPFSSTER